MRKLPALVATIALSAAAGCAVHQDNAPSSTSGPAEAARSLRMAATPDTLVQDGVQSSRVTVTAFDPTGQAIAVNVRLDIVANGSIQEFGTISSHALVTGTDAKNPSFVTYTPPAATSGARSVVLILGTIIDSNAAASNPQQVAINLNPITITAPPGSNASVPAPAAKFTVSPTAPGLNQDVFFNATTSTAASGHLLANFAWDFGDGSTGSGITATHAFNRAGSYVVTLTVTDDVGQTNTTTNSVTVSAVSSQIVASFIFSPQDPTVALGTNTVLFDATASFSPAGIATYAWDFGDATATGSGKQVTHQFTKTGTWVVRLTVTDNAGKTATTTQNVTVK